MTSQWHLSLHYCCLQWITNNDSTNHCFVYYWLHVKNYDARFFSVDSSLFCFVADIESRYQCSAQNRSLSSFSHKTYSTFQNWSHQQKVLVLSINSTGPTISWIWDCKCPGPGVGSQTIRPRIFWKIFQILLNILPLVTSRACKKVGRKS